MKPHILLLFFIIIIKEICFFTNTSFLTEKSFLTRAYKIYGGFIYANAPTDKQKQKDAKKYKQIQTTKETKEIKELRN